MERIDCVGPCGWVMEIASAEWFVEVPRMTAKTLSLSAMASSSRLTITEAHPSARQYPSAPWSKVAHGPVFERNCPLLRPEKMSGLVDAREPADDCRVAFLRPK